MSSSIAMLSWTPASGNHPRGSKSRAQLSSSSSSSLSLSLSMSFTRSAATLPGVPTTTSVVGNVGGRLRSASLVVAAAGDADGPSSSSPPSYSSSSDDASVNPTLAAARATDVRVRCLRGEDEIPGIARLCAAVFKEVAVPMPDGADGEVLQDIAEFLESRYEQAMIKDLTSIITRNQREKRRAGNQVHAAAGRIRARATARELQALQRTRTSVDALTTEQLTEMRARISDEAG